MPMTTRQLDQVEQDYKPYVPPSWRVVAVEQRQTSWSEDRAKLRCAICNRRLDPGGVHKEITWKPGYKAIALRFVKALVCRNGVTCRERAEVAA